MKRHKGNYKKIAKFLSDNGYKVEKKIVESFSYPSLGIYQPEYTFWLISGKGIEGARGGGV